MTAPPISALAYAPDAATGAAPAVLAVRQLRLTDFRNYRQLRLDCSCGPVVLVGANGAGKTNLLEALSFLAPGRGLRRARLHPARKKNTTSTPKNTWMIAVGAEVAKSSSSDPGGATAVVGDALTGPVLARCVIVRLRYFSSVA